MALQKPIVVVDDDIDDRELIESIFEELQVTEKRIYFTRCSDALAYLTSTSEQPLIIICDINLPIQNGVDFKKQIDADPYLRQKSIPFVFLSTSASKPIINIAYSELVVQGFFEKESNMKEFRNTIDIMIKYWKCCKHPNS